MFERSLSLEEVEEVLKRGDIVDAYPDDKPFASFLVLGFVNQRPIHVVAAMDSQSQTAYIVTAYDPDPDLWDSDFRTRRSP